MVILWEANLPIDIETRRVVAWVSQAVVVVASIDGNFMGTMFSCVFLIPALY